MRNLRSFLFLCLGSLGLLLLFVPVHAQPAAERERNATFQRGKALFEQGKYQEAAKALERAVELSVQLFGADDTRTMAMQGLLGIVYFKLKDPTKAEPLVLRLILSDEKRHGKRSPEVASSLCTLGSLFTEIGDQASAEGYLVRGVKMWEALPEEAGRRGMGPEFDYSYLASLYHLGWYCNDRGEHAKAEALLLRAQKIWDAGKDRDSNGSMTSLQTLAEVYRGLGEYSKAAPLFERVVKTREATLGDSRELAMALEQQAQLHMLMGQLAQSEKAFQRAVKIYEAKLGKDHPETVTCLQAMGPLYRRMEKYDQAEACYARALKILEAKYGADSPELGHILENMAVLENYRKEDRKALTIRQRSLRMVEARRGADHPDTALVLSHIGESYWKLRDPAKAEAFWLRALTIYEARLGADHPSTAGVLYWLGVVQASSGRWEEALRSFDRERRATRRYIARVLPGLSEAQQLTFLETQQVGGLFSDTLSAGMRSTDATAVARSAEWLLNGKAITQQALAERGLQALASADPAQAKLLRQLRTVRSQLASLTLATPQPGQEAAQRKEFDRLAGEEQELAKRLGQAMGRPTRDDPWVGLDEVRQALPGDAVLVEIAEFSLGTFKNDDEKPEPHFVAWIIPATGKGQVKLVDLGTAEPIEKAVAAVRKALQESSKSTIAKGESEAEKELRPSFQALSKLIVEPLLPHIGEKKHWILSPDTELWLVPWAALPLQDGSYAVEKHTISYVISGRDLVTPPVKAPVKRDPPLVMADPDFDIEPKEAAALTAQLLGKPVQPTSGVAAILDAPPSLRSASGVGRVARLPGTAAEAVAIKPKLQAYAGEEPWIYRGKNALEGIFKAWHSPKVLVLSTHGYFLEDDKKGTVHANPLLRCGLLLAGCNQRGKATGVQEDGVLTGLEIVSSDLRGTELVVLSACETGLGDLKSGEGVSGLRQAFQLAGAQTVVASLWQVSDRDTALLMSDFFDGLAKGKSKAEALREAQLLRIQAHRDRDGAAHPFYWAAFTVTGK